MDLGCVVACGLIERVLEHDVRVLRQIDADDDPIPPNVRSNGAHAVEKPRFTYYAHARGVLHPACPGGRERRRTLCSLRTPPPSCNCWLVPRDPDAVQLRAVAPLLANGRLVAPVLVVSNGPQVMAATSAELLRPLAGAVPLVIATKLDGSASVPVAAWGMGRFGMIGLLELGAPLGNGHDVEPLDLGAVCASTDTRGAPSAFVVLAEAAGGFIRTLVPVHVDGDDGAGMSDVIARVATPLDATHASLAVEGAPLFTWFPPNPALGRANEVLVMGLGHPYRGHAKPRDLAVLAEVVGLEELGRVLLSTARTEEKEPDLKQVAGEIEDHELADIPALKGLDET